jgi:uracil-DNA glycosylase family 4
MRHLPLYPEPPRAPVDLLDGDALDRSCTRCSWSAGPGRACLPPDGRPGGLLVVGDVPTQGANRPFVSKTGSFVRSIVEKHWTSKPVVYDYAIKCAVGKGGNAKNAPIEECRTYMTRVLQDAQPERVIALGPWAIASLLGRNVDVESVRSGYGWVLGDVPVFLFGSPAIACENNFLRPRYERDLKHALTRPRPRPTHLDNVVHVVETEADALLAEELLEVHDELLFDVETAGIPHAPDFTVLCAGLAPVDDLESECWVWSSAALVDPGAHVVLARLLTTKKIAGSNVKYDLIAAALRLDAPSIHVSFDTQLLRKLLEPTCKGRLEYAAELVGMGGHKEEADGANKRAIAAARRKKWRPGDVSHDHWCVQAIRNGAARPLQYAYGLLPDNVLWRYNARDITSAAAATVHLRKRAQEKQPHEWKCWTDIYQPAVASFARIERVGIAADRRSFEAFSAHLRVGLDELAQQFKAYDRPDQPFNPNSTAQVANLLFKRLGLPMGEISDKGNPTTNKEALEGLRGMHPVVDQITEHRRLEKLDNTYGAGLIVHIRPDGRIHPTFRLDGAETGRISSEDPNSQNQPRADSEEGKMLRDCFIAAPGKILIELDQSQIELRVAAGMSGDELMIEIFRSGIDYHLRTAQMISQVAWSIAPELVTDVHRTGAKSVNFGLLYGKTDAGLAAQLGCSLEQAARIRKAILGKFKKLDALIKKLLYHVRQKGWVEVPWINGAAHRRPLYDAGGHDKWKRNTAENGSINTPVQGRAAWYTIAAIPAIHAWLDASGVDAEIVNTVHDSIMLEVDEDQVDTVVENCSAIMTSFDCWGVPLVVDVKAGTRWGSMRKMKKGESYLDAGARWIAESEAA